MLCSRILGVAVLNKVGSRQGGKGVQVDITGIQWGDRRRAKELGEVDRPENVFRKIILGYFGMMVRGNEYGGARRG